MCRVLAIPEERRSHVLHEYSLLEIWELPEVYANQQAERNRKLNRPFIE
jgi:hypothetical protein